MENNQKSFMFFDNFLEAIEQLPESERANACYQLCRYAINGELPEDKSLAMFCIGVRYSIRKYQGRGGKRNGAGRPKKTKEENNQNNQKNQKNQNAQTEKEKNMCETNPFWSLTNNTEIHNALSDPESSLNFFLTIGEGYDELSSKEREFVDRGDVRSKCPWVKELQKARQFIAPTLEQVLEYARQQNSIAMCGGFACSEQVAEEFWSHYESQDWRISNESNTPIRDWKPKLRQWCLREKKQQSQQKQFTPRMSLKDMKEMQNEIEVQKILKGER